MIWFACKSCGAKASRPDSEAGALVFCSCGQANRVPFTSTVPPEVDFPEVVHVPEPPPRVEPPRGAREVPIPQAAAVPVPIDEARPAPRLLPPSEPPLSFRKAPRRYRKPDPAVCWHHEDLPSGGSCSACKLPFCIDCLCDLNGAQLCGPCKNFRVEEGGSPLSPTPMASAALAAALVAAPVSALLSLAGAGAFLSEGSAAGAVVLCLVGLAMLGGSLWLCVGALRGLEAESRVGGRGLVASGLSISLAGLAWCLCVLTVVLGRGLAR
jgi:hypothetical protein